MLGANELAVDDGGIGDKSGTGAPGVDRGSAEMEHDATVMNNDLSDFKIKSDSYGILSVERRVVVDTNDLTFRSFVPVRH